MSSRGAGSPTPAKCERLPMRALARLTLTASPAVSSMVPASSRRFSGAASCTTAKCKIAEFLAGPNCSACPRGPAR
eukprot:6284296-Pyramimonas_sp.AAC.1